MIKQATTKCRPVLTTVLHSMSEHNAFMTHQCPATSGTVEFPWSWRWTTIALPGKARKWLLRSSGGWCLDGWLKYWTNDSSASLLTYQGHYVSLHFNQLSWSQHWFLNKPVVRLNWLYRRNGFIIIWLSSTLPVIDKVACNLLMTHYCFLQHTSQPAYFLQPSAKRWPK